MSEPQVGGLITAAPVCWLSGGRRLVVGFGNALRAYVIQDNGKPKPSASFHGHESRVVAMLATGPMRVASASKDGTIHVWDVEDGTLLRTVDCGKPLLDMVGLSDGRVVVACAFDVSVLTLERTIDETPVNGLRVLMKFSRAIFRRVSVSADGSIIATITGNSLWLIFNHGERSTHTRRIAFRKKLTSVAISADGCSLAVGNEIGVVFVYRNLEEARKKGRDTSYDDPVFSYSSLHWHSYHVLSLRFSQYGNILYSGGCEGVLVVWNMTKTDFGKRKFKPRLDGAIWGIAPSEDESCIALTHADNSVRILESVGMNIVAVLRGISTAHLRNLPPWQITERRKKAHKLIHLTPEPGKSGYVIVAGMGNVVQLYDVFRGFHVADMQIVARNTVMSGKSDNDTDDVELSQTVCHITVSADMKFMASVTRDVHPLSESKTCADNIFIETLKFWDYKEGSGNIELISRIDEPHGSNGTITSIAFHPFLPVLATSSSCGTFKFWRAVSPDNKGENILWRCELTKNYRNISCEKLAFSVDGSVLAVGNKSSISLWSIEDFSDLLHSEGSKNGFISLAANCSLKVSFMYVLVHPPAEETIGHLSFVKENSPYLLATTCNGLYIWDILERRIWWSNRLVNRPECTISDPSSGRFAVVVKFERDGPPLDFLNESPLPNPFEATSHPKKISIQESKKKRLHQKKTPRREINKVDASRNTASNPKRQRHEVPLAMDTAVALFSVSSPVPISVSRLPVGSDVGGISFVCDGRNTSTSKIVFCFDTNMEIVPISCNGDIENISDVTAPEEADEQELSSNQELIRKTQLKELIGDSWRDAANVHEDVPRADLPSTQNELAPIRKILSKYLDASAGIQPSIISVAVPLLRSLSNVAQTSAKQMNKPEVTVLAQASYEKLNVPHTNEAQKTKAVDTEQIQTEYPKVNLDSMSSFLKSFKSSP